MKLKDIFPNRNFDKTIGNLNIKNVSDDSRLIQKDDVFFILKKKNFDMFSKLSKICSKPKVFIVDLRYKKKIDNIIKNKPIVFVKNINKEYLRVVKLFYGLGKGLPKIIGITGTNGKTTTAFLVYELLKKMGKNPSLIGTVKYLIGKKTQKAAYTTPPFLYLQKLLGEAKEAGSDFVIMEVSSHAIDQERIKGINFSYCLFTNLSRDHLDYHKTFKNYFNTKKKLFSDNKKAISFINIDDSYGRKLKPSTKKKVTYGLSKEADFRADNISLSPQGSIFSIVYKGETYPAYTSFLGKHNVLNVLGGVSLLKTLGFSIDKIVKNLSSVRHVLGRLQPICPDVFIDYAHTPDALEKVLKTLRNIGYQRIICVFGCGGDRDKGKRKVMGHISSKYADYTFITSDNPRTEKPKEICHQIKEGFKKNNFSISIDRTEAIRRALKLFKKKQKKGLLGKICVIVAGKGHEDCQITNKGKIPFKDSKVIRSFIGNRKLK